MSQGRGYARSLPPSPVASTCNVPGRCRWISLSGLTTSLRGREPSSTAGESVWELDHTIVLCTDSASTTMCSRGVSSCCASAHSDRVETNAATFVSPCHCTAFLHCSSGNLGGRNPVTDKKWITRRASKGYSYVPIRSASWLIPSGDGLHTSKSSSRGLSWVSW